MVRSKEIEHRSCYSSSISIHNHRETKATWGYKVRKDYRDRKVLQDQKASRVMME